MGWTHRLFGLCDHKWVEDRREEVVDRSKVYTERRKVGEVSYCHCEKCGLPHVFPLAVITS